MVSPTEVAVSVGAGWVLLPSQPGLPDGGSARDISTHEVGQDISLGR